MTNQELICAALAATRGSSIDHKTAAIGADGVRAGDIETLSYKWAMHNWTGFDPKRAAQTLAELAASGLMDEHDGAYVLSSHGTAALRSRIAELVGDPKTIDEFNLGLAFHRLIDDETYRAALERYAVRLDESVSSNDWKRGQLKGTAFEDLMTVIAAQLRATKTWLDAKVAEGSVR